MDRTPGPNRGEDALVREFRRAYGAGWFPMNDPDRAVIEWVQPERRAVIPLGPGGLRTGRSLRARVRSGRLEIRSDTAFEAVIRACAAPAPGRESTWIDERIVGAYSALHRAGVAHSVEARRPAAEGGALVGGLYGLHFGGAFFGESMFSRPGAGGRDASKVCLVHLVAHLRRRGFELLDAQIMNDHIARLGAVEMDRAEFLGALRGAMAKRCEWGEFEPGGPGA